MMKSLSIISFERVNWNILNRTCTISQGNSTDQWEGESGQYTQDSSFTTNLISLLDPVSAKETLRFRIANTVFFENPNHF